MRIPLPIIGALIDSPSCGHSALLERWADGVAQRIDELPHGIALRVGEHAHDLIAARDLAHRLAGVLRHALVRRGAPEAMAIECDLAQATDIHADRPYRTLLPHHDGGNASFLTPSALDDPTFGPEVRRTHPPSVTTTRRHKMYQGFLLSATGDCESVTTYYDLLALVRVAYEYQNGATAGSIAELGRWMGTNVRHALTVINERDGTYVTLGGMLGSRKPVDCLTAVHVADARFTSDQLERFPELGVAKPSDNDGLSPSEQFFDRVLRGVTGHGWLATRERYEVGVHGIQHDFIIGRNLTLLHGGWRGGRGRIIEPICFTLDSPSGEGYEKWLSQAWRRPAGVSEHED